MIVRNVSTLLAVILLTHNFNENNILVYIDNMLAIHVTMSLSNWVIERKALTR